MTLTPIFVAFLLTHVPLILYAIFRHLPDLPAVGARVSADLNAASAEMGWLGVGALLLRAYSMGAGTYTGIEAVSNSMQTLREPRVHTGKRAMLYLAVLPGLHGGRDHRSGTSSTTSPPSPGRR